MTRGPESAGQSGPRGLAVAGILILVALLMTFSIAAWRARFTEVAVVAGVGACTLVGDLARRLLNTDGSQPPA